MIPFQVDYLWLPYPELNASFNGSKVLLNTPWIHIEAEVQPSACEFAHFCVKNLHSPEFGHQISKFLQPFSNYPIAYGRQESFRRINGQVTWDTVEQFSTSDLGNACDAIAAMTFLRRIRLRKQSERGARISESFGKAPPTKDFVRRSIRQSHYITSGCSRILSGAIDSFPASAQILRDFMQEEKGHDALISRTVQLIEANDIAVMRETENLIELLNSTTQINLLAFAVAVEAFEGTDFTTQESSLARIVEFHFGEEAAAPIRKHYYLNRQHNHGQIGMKLLNEMPSIEVEDVTKASTFLDKFIESQDRFADALFV